MAKCFKHRGTKWIRDKKCERSISMGTKQSISRIDLGFFTTDKKGLDVIYMQKGEIMLFYTSDNVLRLCKKISSSTIVAIHYVDLKELFGNITSGLARGCIKLQQIVNKFNEMQQMIIFRVVDQSQQRIITCRIDFGESWNRMDIFGCHLPVDVPAEVQEVFLYQYLYDLYLLV